MPFYLYQIAYTPEAMKAMVANPQDRTKAAEQLVEALGGKLHHLFFAFGKFDVICLIEGTDDTMMAAGAMAVAAAGTVSRSETVKLLTAAEAREAMTRAGKATGAYKAPSAA
ncbi:GYD domain-containing protein [Pararhodobacter sp. SW119]|uniref:GYD domain-containing protein n=1 Tax=Pararhodobacter sp. SW119 TaxID=2780075 RepID=UPI001ADF989B|nr:GYD domain-containing protein [Pararhodobacter sp. SW119]